MVVQRKICLIGEFSVGKTSLVSQFVHSIFSESYHTTVGVKIDKKVCVIDNSQVNLVIWDLAGESPLKTLKPSQIMGASGFLLVADGTRPDTVDLAIALQQRVVQLLGTVPFIFALNKADLVDEWSASMPEITERLTQKGWDVRLTSAKTGQEVEKMFHDLAARMIEVTGDSHAG